MSMEIRSGIILGVRHLSGGDYWKGPRLGGKHSSGFPLWPLCCTAIKKRIVNCVFICKYELVFLH